MASGADTVYHTGGRLVVEQQKLLSLMRFWLLGPFVIVLVATTVYVGLYTEKNWLVAFESSFPVWAITGVLCIAWYYVYKWYISRKN